MAAATSFTSLSARLLLEAALLEAGLEQPNLPKERKHEAR